ncbi:MAG: response regulator transcription factor [Phascolarctobacterium sp.]|uniref:winged helix-turn-helix domain-containing protein n=1 Tax=Phascolarctobacterium sp. TaxID=2049039 RepID=UPI0026DBBF9D|nr:response regulator transcription factor [Phascolarctobacterium sp.]MDO4921949.1 response regulator transcription factor [Phascolarctobacterium sp.]
MIYCVEDEQNICELEVYTLQSVGMEAKGCGSGRELFAELEKRVPKLIVLDIMLPDEDGVSILRRLRADKRYAAIPVIMATAKGSEFDKVKGLDSGADDYIAKPFGMLEMVARIKAVLRRCAAQSQLPAEDIIRVANLEVNSSEHKVSVDGQEVVLTLKEYELLKKFLLHPGIVFSRDKLLNDIWGYEFSGETRTVDVHIRTLRQKLGSAGDLVETIRGVGYRMAAEK